ncbi:intraflagellar transport protein 25 homolog isoform X3 [Struthio camelus]
MFPQEFIIGFPACVKVRKVAVQCYLGESPFLQSAGCVGLRRACVCVSVCVSVCLSVPLISHRFVASLRTLRIERSVSKEPVDFEQCIEKDLQYTEGELQTAEFPLPDFQATYLRFIIKSAFDHFVSVHRVMAEGTAENI